LLVIVHIRRSAWDPDDCEPARTAVDKLRWHTLWHIEPDPVPLTAPPHGLPPRRRRSRGTASWRAHPLLRPDGHARGEASLPRARGCAPRTSGATTSAATIRRVHEAVVHCAKCGGQLQCEAVVGGVLGLSADRGVGQGTEHRRQPDDGQHCPDHPLPLMHGAHHSHDHSGDHDDCPPCRGGRPANMLARRSAGSSPNANARRATTGPASAGSLQRRDGPVRAPARPSAGLPAGDRLRGPPRPGW
jgi:hypothetical protein